MKSLKKRALRSMSKYEFKDYLLRWYYHYVRRYPVIKTWTKKDAYNFYHTVTGRAT